MSAFGTPEHFTHTCPRLSNTETPPRNRSRSHFCDATHSAPDAMALYSVSICPSAWMSVRFICCMETTKHIFKRFFTCSPTILLFPHALINGVNLNNLDWRQNFQHRASSGLSVTAQFLVLVKVVAVCNTVINTGNSATLAPSSGVNLISTPRPGQTKSKGIKLKLTPQKIQII